MIPGGGRCLFSLVIVTGFLLGSAYGQTTDGPITTPAQSTDITTPALTTDEPTTPDTNDCDPNPCMNDGTCTDETDSYMCNCTGTGFDGINCTIDINECASGPCDNGGTCVNKVNMYTCDCFPGYAGTNCETEINECASNPCVNGACMNEVNGYICNCAPGYTGIKCDADINECASAPCDKGGTCVNKVNMYTCDCFPGYEGTNCETDINECASNPCMNGGTCNDLVNGYNCTCLEGFNGTQCEKDINECASDPCMNGGTCNDMVNGYNCTCLEGFNGTHCEEDIDACDPDPCVNGNCTNLVMNMGDANYICECPPGLTGRNCSEDIRECFNDTCQNGGTCYEGINFFNCTCAPGFNGTYCKNKCPAGTYGDYCMEDCTCVEAANCSHVDGSCTCSNDTAVCDKRNLTVTASRIHDGEISEGDDVTLACRVNLVGTDLDGVTWYRDSMKLPSMTDGNYRVDIDADMGMYNITILGAGAEDTGNYNCTAVTEGGQFTESSEAIPINVVVTGKIDFDRSQFEDSIQLNQTASLNCTVFSSSDDTSIAWEQNGVRLMDSGNRISIAPLVREKGTGGTFFSSLLEISDIIREDNGSYTCLALNGTGNMTDSADFQIFVLEVAELANPRYTKVKSMELSLQWDFTVPGNAELNCTAKYRIRGTDKTEEQEVGGTSPGVVTNLKPYTMYEFELLCENLVGISEPLQFGTVQTLAGEPSMPQTVETADLESRQVRVSWERPEETNGPIDSYEVTATGVNTENVSGSFDGDETSGILDGLTPHKQYKLTVQAVNLNSQEGLQISIPSPAVIFTTLQDVPGSPNQLGTDQDADQCSITWKAPSEPNGVITNYTLYTQVFRSDTGASDGILKKREFLQVSFTYDKSQLPLYSFFRFSVTASTEIGEGPNATTTDTCDTPQGVPVMPQPIPTPADDAISQTSFMITLQPYDERNGPVSCYEVIVVELENKEAGRSLQSTAPGYHPDQIRSYSDAKDAKGIPYRAVVFSNPPANGELAIGATSDDITTCHTGNSAGSSRRRRRETTSTSSLSAVNGPLNSGGVYSSFVRVYTPSTEQPGMAFYESGPFMSPVTLQSKSNVAGIVGGIFGFLIVVGLTAVIVLMVYRRRKDHPGDPLMTPTINGRENGNPTLVPMDNLEPEVIVKPIKLEYLERTIRDKAKDEKKIFYDEYKALPNKPPPLATKMNSELPANNTKNRYINIIAYDHTRVKLKAIDGIEGSDYINASYVNGYQTPDKFIAAQGPKDNTLEDFWRMIWEYNCSTIVMLTKCVEDGKDKCSQYWPDKGSIKYGRFEVKLDTIKETAEYVIRSFFLSEDGKESGQRSITQFHFLGWPDHGQPDYPNPMMCLIKRVRHLTSKMNHRANIVVHCSAGVGRTGTYIVIDAMLDKMKHEKQVDIYNFIHEIRQQRNTLVQSFVQYFFIHIALLEEHLFGHTDVGMTDFPAYYQQLSNKSELNEDLTKLEIEFRNACKLGVNGTEQTFANIDQNKDKNRIGHILPYDKNIVKLERLIGEEFSDYINASYITGYERKNMYIATQGPLPNTIADFWRMIWESQTSTIVMLTETTQKGHEMCAQYWPLEIDEIEEHGDISVTLMEEIDEDEAFTIRDVEISHAHMKDIRKIRQYHFRGWPELGVPESGIDLLRMVNKSHLHQKDKGAYPIVVHCSAGAGRTGVFIALNVMMSRMEEESMIDVFQTVRGLRQQRPHMVQDLAQYKFCSSAMAEYIENQSTEYQNFVPRV